MFPFLLGLGVGLVVTLTVSTFAWRAARRRILALRDRARQAERLAELGVLTGGLAHEIKNPLSTIQMNLQLLQEDLSVGQPVSARVIHSLNMSLKETSRLRDTLDDFLRYAGRLELDRKPVKIRDLVEEMVDFFTPQAQAQKVQLCLSPGTDNFTVSVDERLIKQALLNLLLNGAQAMPSGGDLILKTRRVGDNLALDVIDTGRGIPPESLAHIFDAYYSTRKGGTGLGLAMTQRIAREHGGRVEVSSEPGKGSQFTLLIPIQK